MHGTMKRVPKPNWRLKKTLARRVEVRVMEPNDIKFLWAAYKKGGLAEMDPALSDGSMSADEFRTAFDVIAARYSEGWTIIAETPRNGVRPVGAVFGALAPLVGYVIVAGIAWFPWASRRNVVEGTIAFFNTARRHFPMIGYATGGHSRLYEVCCMHGIMRRIGTSHAVFPGQPAAVYETRSIKK